MICSVPADKKKTDAWKRQSKGLFPEWRNNGKRRDFQGTGPEKLHLLYNMKSLKNQGTNCKMFFNYKIINIYHVRKLYGLTLKYCVMWGIIFFD